MIWKLTDQVWWGDRLSIGEDVPGVVINLADNLSLNYHHPDEPSDYEFLSLPETVPYFRISVADAGKPTQEFLTNIQILIQMAERMKWFPILFHCWEGVHRSLTTAIFADLCLKWPKLRNMDKAEPFKYFQHTWDHMEKLRPEFCLLEYGKELLKLMVTVTQKDNLPGAHNLVQSMFKGS